MNEQQQAISKQLDELTEERSRIQAEEKKAWAVLEQFYKQECKYWN